MLIQKYRVRYDMKQQQIKFQNNRRNMQENKKKTGSGLNAQKFAHEGHSDTRKVYRKMRERNTKKDPRNKDNTKPSSHKNGEREKGHSEVVAKGKRKNRRNEPKKKNQVFLCVDPVWRFHHPRNPPIDVSSSCRGGTTNRPSGVPRGACMAPAPANATECP